MAQNIWRRVKANMRMAAAVKMMDANLVLMSLVIDAHDSKTVMSSFIACSSCSADWEIFTTKMHVAPYSERVVALLTSNQLPLGEEVNQLKTRYAETDERIQQLEDHLKRLREMANTLEELKQQQEKARSDLQIILSPARRVPVDIWREIFAQLTDGSAFENSGGAIAHPPCSSLDITVEPWSLTRVSSRWRNICLSQPRLWASIVLYPDSLTQAQTVGQWQLLQRQIARSFELPLSVCYTSARLSDPPSNRVPDPIFAYLGTTAYRWKKLYLSVTDEIISALNWLVDDLPLLTRAKFGPFTSPPSVSATFLAKAKSLDVVSSPWNILASVSLPKTIIFWRTGSHSLRGSEIHALFEAVSCLRWCALSLTGSHDVGLPPIHAHHTLHSLALKGKGSLVSEVLKSFTLLPSLLALKLSTSPLFLEPIASFLRSTTCRLKTLTIRFEGRLQDDTAVFRTMLLAAPRLERFELESTVNNAFDAETLLAIFTERQGDELSVTPHLKGISLRTTSKPPRSTLTRAQVDRLLLVRPSLSVTTI